VQRFFSSPLTRRFASSQFDFTDSVDRDFRHAQGVRYSEPESARWNWVPVPVPVYYSASVHHCHRVHPGHCLPVVPVVPGVPVLLGSSLCPAFPRCLDSVHRFLRVLLARYSLVALQPQAQQGARPVVQLPVASRRPAVAYSKVAADDCLRVLLVHYSLAALQPRAQQGARPVVRSPVASRRPAVAYLQVAADDCLRVHPVNCSMVASLLLPAPALSPAAARSVVVVRDYHRVHPKHCFPDVRRVQSTPLEPAFPAAPA